MLEWYPTTTDVSSYYINPPGTGIEGCLWGTSSNPIGNWAYFVAGANTDSSGNTFVKIGYNPVVQEPATPFRNTPATFGVEITCDEGAGCNGLPCKIDPSVNALNEVTSGESSDGAGGAAFCVVTVPKGQSANIVVFEAGGSDTGSSPTTTSKTSSSSSSTSTSTTPTSTVAPTTTSHSSTTSTSSSSPTSSTPGSTTTPTPSSSESSDSSDASTTPSTTPKSASASYSYAPHVFAETSASGDSGATATPVGGTSSSPSASPSSAASPLSTGSMTGLALGLMAGIMMQF